MTGKSITISSRGQTSGNESGKIGAGKSGGKIGAGKWSILVTVSSFSCLDMSNFRFLFLFEAVLGLNLFRVNLVSLGTVFIFFKH